MNAPYDYNLKIVLLGDFGVGKSSFLKYLGQMDPDSSRCSFTRCKRNGYVELELVRGEKKVLLRVTDTGGQERYRSITSSYYRGANGCILMYDVTREETFQNLQNWHADLQMYGPAQHTSMSAIVVGNRCLDPDRVVTSERGEKQAEHLELPYMEMDVDKQHNVDALCHTLVDTIIEVTARKVSVEHRSVSLESEHQGTRCSERSCCAC